jgi:hypothetical protein
MPRWPNWTRRRPSKAESAGSSPVRGFALPFFFALEPNHASGSSPITARCVPPYVCFIHALPIVTFRRTPTRVVPCSNASCLRFSRDGPFPHPTHRHLAPHSRPACRHTQYILSQPFLHVQNFGSSCAPRAVGMSFLQPVQLHSAPHASPAVKQGQYFFTQRDRLQVHPEVARGKACCHRYVTRP